MNYLQHLKKELYALLFVMPMIIIAVAFTVYYSNSPHISNSSYWARCLAVCTILFLCAEYLKYIYIQKTRSPFKDRLSAAIRKSNTIISEFTKTKGASHLQSTSKIMRYFEILKEHFFKFTLLFSAGLLVSFCFTRNFSYIVANKTFYIGTALIYIIVGPAITLLKEKYNQD
jgi:uncharacterized membrane protein (DUF485 family)